MSQIYSQHIKHLNSRYQTLVARDNLDGVIISSGAVKYSFLDDNPLPHRVNPHFKHWVPVVDNPNCFIYFDGENKPTLIFHQPIDFWYKPAETPTGFWVNEFSVNVVRDLAQARECLPKDLSNIAFIGEEETLAQEWGCHSINSDAVLSYLQFQRITKTAYELDNMRAANAKAVQGHIAARDAFYAGNSEFDIYQAYLFATQQMAHDMPYPAITALNSNGAVLHYCEKEFLMPSKHLSFLLDAGAEHHGYAADITRTYSFDPSDEFAELIAAIDVVQQSLVSEATIGMAYLDLHIAMHRKLAVVLNEFGLVHADAEAIFAAGITHTFCPHGLGHLIGAQCHDPAGHQSSEQGDKKLPPIEYPALRNMQQIQANQSFTIEPGCYFIESLLKELAASEHASMVNWDKVEQLKPYGGIRIEDNIFMHSDRTENITRDAFD